MADGLAVGIQKGEGHGPVDGVKVLFEIQRRRERPQKVRQQVQKQDGGGDDAANPHRGARQAPSMQGDPRDQAIRPARQNFQELLPILAHAGR